MWKKIRFKFEISEKFYKGFPCKKNFPRESFVKWTHIKIQGNSFVNFSVGGPRWKWKWSEKWKVKSEEFFCPRFRWNLAHLKFKIEIFTMFVFSDFAQKKSNQRLSWSFWKESTRDKAKPLRGSLWYWELVCLKLVNI